MLSAYGPGDITAVAILPGKQYVLEEVTDYSVSSHFDQIQMRRLGHHLGQGWATGAGTVAGTLVCAQFTQGALWKLRRHAGAVRLLRDQAFLEQDPGAASGLMRARLDLYTAGILPQQLPPFHLMFVHANQDGQMAIARLYDVKIQDHGEIKGASNAFTEETLQFQALFYEQIVPRRSLTTNELAQLAGKLGAFFNDPRRAVGLAEGLESVIGLSASGDQVAGILGDEVALLEERLRTGGETPVSIADQGDVVFIRLEEDPASKVVKMATLPPEDARGDGDIARFVDIPIREVFTLRSGTVTTREAVLAIRGSNLYITGGAQVSDDELAVTTPVARIPLALEVGTIRLGGAAYAQLVDSALPPREHLFLPTEVTLQYDLREGRNLVTRQARYSPSAFPLMRLSPPAAEAEGTYAAAGFFPESYLLSDGTLSGSIGPFTVSGTTTDGETFALAVASPGAGSAPARLTRRGDSIALTRESAGLVWSGAASSPERAEAEGRLTLSAAFLSGELEVSAAAESPYDEVELTASYGGASTSARVAARRTGGLLTAAARLAPGLVAEVTLSAEGPSDQETIALRFSLDYLTRATRTASSPPVPARYAATIEGEPVELSVSGGQVSGRVGPAVISDVALGAAFDLAEGSDLTATVVGERLTLSMRPRTLT